MIRKAVFIAVSLTVSSQAFSQRLDPRQATLQPQAAKNNDAANTQNQVGQLNMGVKAASGVGPNTSGIGTQTKGYGNQITGYGSTTKGLPPVKDCNTYPPDPYRKC